MIDRMVFVDTETSDLDVVSHRVWEIGMVVCDLDAQPLEQIEWELYIDPAIAAPEALRVGGLYRRHKQHLLRDPATDPVAAEHNRRVAAEVAAILDNVVFAGVNPAFDAGHLRQLMRDWGQAPCWHHHLVCAVNAAAQRLLHTPPFTTQGCIKGLRVDTGGLTAHTALDDAELARRMYLAARKPWEQRPDEGVEQTGGDASKPTGTAPEAGDSPQAPAGPEEGSGASEGNGDATEGAPRARSTRNSSSTRSRGSGRN